MLLKETDLSHLRLLKGSDTRFGEISPLRENLKSFLYFLGVYFVFGKLLTPFGQILYVLGHIYNDVNGQKMKNNLATWSYCIRGMFSGVAHTRGEFTLSTFSSE